MLAAGQYVIHLRQYFGYWWSYQLGLSIIEEFENATDGASSKLDIGDSASATLGAAADSVESIFRLNADPEEFQVIQGEPPISRQRLVEVVEANPNRDRLLVRHMETNTGESIFVVLYPVAGQSYWYGFNFKSDALAERFRFVFENWPLLPEPLVGDLEKNHGIRIKLIAPEGGVAFESIRDISDGRRVEFSVDQVSISDNYEGLFAGFRVSASLDPELADMLIIGGVPKSRLPTLVALMVLTQIVLVAIFWVLFKERAVARMRSDFVSRVSHEFRTPLTQIRMFAETLLLGRERNADDRERQLRIINREAKRLGHMVSNVLTLAGQDRRQFHTQLQAVPVCELLVGIIDEYRTMLVHSDTTIELTGCNGRRSAIRAILDPEAFTQVMTNLLDNACKYGPKGQTIRIAFESDQEHCRIAVEDEGPGIPESEREKIWQLYYRLEREDKRAINGTGIGLPIARELLTAMKGSCRIESASGGGARFVVSLEKVKQ